MNHTASRQRTCPPGSRRGSVYLLVICVCAIVTTIGLASVALARIDLRRVDRTSDRVEAEILATAAIEHAFAVINAAPDWRQLMPSGELSPVIQLGAGSFRWRMVDEADQDLLDDYSEPARIYGEGTVNDALRIYSVTIEAGGLGLDVLTTALHADGDIDVGGDLIATGGPISSNGAIANGGTVTGNIEATGGYSGNGTLNGVAIDPAPRKQMPPQFVEQPYLDVATPIDFAMFHQGKMEAPLLSAAVNPYGPVNPDGIYTISVPDSAVFQIKCDRIRGTLIVQLGNDAELEAEYGTLWEPHRVDLPTLIVRGGLNSNVMLGGPSELTISETTLGVNLNPPGTPYRGETDDLIDDVYDVTIDGLIHSTSASTTVDLVDKLRVMGTVLVQGPVTTDKDVTLTVDPMLVNRPPSGYGVGETFQPNPRSWRWEVLPTTP